MYQSISSTLIRCLLVAIAVVAWLGLAQTQTAQAQSFSESTDMAGYAWSSNVGWISMNCENTDTCGTVEYNVTVGTDNDIDGYAWSSNVGWIQFGNGLGGCPTGGNCDARFDGSNEVVGWARALSHDDGWDGWISLSCQNSSGCGTSDYGLTLAGPGFDDVSYAWGSDVVGWVDFSAVNVVAICDDGIDNDGDGLTDYPADPGCDSPDDQTEQPTHCWDPMADNYRAEGACTYPPACDNTLDDDGDGLIDYTGDGTGDPGCTDANDDDEYNDPLPDPMISLDVSVSRQYATVELSWDPNGNTGCSLSTNVVDSGGSTPDGSTAGSVDLTADRPTTYTLSCDYGQEASVQLRVVPTIFET